VIEKTQARSPAGFSERLLFAFTGRAEKAEVELG
jgi:hypothetical protein